MRNDIAAFLLAATVLSLIALACAIIYANGQALEIKRLKAHVEKGKVDLEDFKLQAVRKGYAEYNRKTGRWQWSTFLIVTDEEEEE